MEMKKNNVRLNKYLKSFSASVLSETETIVPDNKPDLLKILDVGADISTFNKSVNDGNFGAGGSVYFTILYIPESADGISSINTTAAFNFNEDMDDITGDSCVTITPSVEHVEYTVLNSRKIAVKAIISLNIEITCPAEISLCENVSGDDIEISMKNFKGLNRISDKSFNINISEQCTLSDSSSVVDIILKSCGNIYNKDIKIISNKVILKGDFVVKMMYLDENGSICVNENSLPFTEILDAEGVHENAYTAVSLSVSDFSLACTPDSSNNLTVNATIRADIVSDEEISCETVNDVYSLSCNLSPDVIKSSVHEFCEMVCEKTEMKENINLSDFQIDNIFNITATPAGVCVSQSDKGKTVIKGNLNTNVLYITKNSDMPVQSHKTEIPFEILMPVNDSYDILIPKICIDNISYSFSGFNIEMKVEISASLTCLNNSDVNVINNIKESDFGTADTPSIVLYFVQKNDTLWDIAKRYHTKANYIEDLNGTGGELIPGAQLLIPKS